jgi:tungstate transport system ATP-binding protein
MRLLDLLESPSSGRVYFDGVDVTRSPRLRLEARRRMSFVLQKPTVFNMSVFDNVACGLRWRHEDRKVILPRVHGVLELVGIADYKNRNARTLSGGETQRLAIARALAVQPEVLFLDEPTANLDPVSISKIEEVLAHIIREQKTTIVMATHDMGQGQRLADRIGVLMNGAVLQTGDPEDIFSLPQSRELAEFIGVENILNGVIVARDDNLVTIDVDGSLLQAISSFNIEEEVHVLIKPEDVILTPHKEVSSARNNFAGKIEKIIPAGPVSRVKIDCGFPLLSMVTKKSTADLSLEVGKQVYAAFKATVIHVIKRWNSKASVEGGGVGLE